MAVINSMYKDFDAMFSQMKDDTIPFKIFGKVYQIKKSIPASIVLEMARMEEGHTLSSKFLYQAAEQIFGSETLREITSHPGFSAEMLNVMIEWAFTAINGKEKAVEELTEDDAATDPEKN